MTDKEILDQVVVKRAHVEFYKRGEHHYFSDQVVWTDEIEWIHEIETPREIHGPGWIVQFNHSYRGNLMMTVVMF